MKTLSLILTITLIIISAIGVQHAPLPLRPFLHANIFHCLANCWSLLICVFITKASLRELLLSYIIALLLLHTSHTYIIGLSGLVYTLTAIILMRVNATLRQHLIMLACVAITLLIPQFAGVYHLLCYLAGLFVGIFFAPIPQWIKKHLPM